MSDLPDDAAPLPSDIDIFCLEYGYNLRGLSGDPRRCPECGFDNPMTGNSIPEPLIASQLDRLELFRVLHFLAFLLCAPLALAFALGSSGYADHPVLSGCSLFAIVPANYGIVIPVVGCISFWVSCGRKPGWLRLWLQFQLLGFAALFLPLVAVCHAFLNPYHISAAIAFVAYLILVAAFAVISAFAFAHRYAVLRRRIREMQREFATVEVRRAIRRRLLRGKCGVLSAVSPTG